MNTNKLNINELPIWGEIKLGTGLKTAFDFRIALKKVGIIVGNLGDDSADAMLGNLAFKVAKKETEAELVVVTNAELGFGYEGTTVKKTYARAKELGLELCPNEVGPQLCLQYRDRVEKEKPFFLIAMRSMALRNLYGSKVMNVFNIFYVSPYDNEYEGDDGVWLGGNKGGPQDVWLGNTSWVFVRRGLK
jgi:hypothetical protein